MSEPQLPAFKRQHKPGHDWNKIGAIATVLGTIVAVVALYPMISGAFRHSDNRRVFDGPIGQIAFREKGWDPRGFSRDDLNSMADRVAYKYAGHYTDEVNGDRNPYNTMCAITLRANPSSSYPYGGDSGFVYVQAGTTKKAQGVVLHNPTVDEIYRTRMNYEYVPAECYPGPPGKIQYEHTFDELFK
ncbi:MAG TPA: hypothetical protein VMY99_04565 [Nevskiaceae bacterium]|nr:hypothetical protein [Nevskiaceae bacterium]